jgi:hypothetical protein
MKEADITHGNLEKLESMHAQERALVPFGYAREHGVHNQQVRESARSYTGFDPDFSR